jgi:polyisoprenoid-binding protein YceI
MRRFVLTAIFAMLAAAATCPVIAADQYKVDAIHSSIVFRIKHMGVSYCYGRFNKVSGVFNLDAQDPAASEIDVTVESGSIDTASEQRDQHLRSPDFFDAAKYPTIRFRATKTGRQGSGPFTVTGNLTLHGVTRPVTVEIEAVGSGKGMLGEVRSGMETLFTIRRSDFGMDKMVGPVGDDVRMMVSLEGIRQ